ncbi:MAG: hypothetical protein H7839_17730 [Magnetococcus sp. YQC-5]
MRHSTRSQPTPRWLIALVLIALVLQTTWKLLAPVPKAHMQDLDAPPSLEWLRLTTLGDPITMASFWMLWLQSFDDQAGVVVPFQKINFHHLSTWLERILALDPQSEYPLLAALRVYGFVPDPDKQRLMIDFIHRAFLADPTHRWSWLAFAALQARHRLGDHQRARLFLDDLEKNIRTQNLPFWIRGLRARILTEQHELEGAKAVIGGLMLHETVNERQKQAMETWLEKLEEQAKKDLGRR